MSSVIKLKYIRLLHSYMELMKQLRNSPVFNLCIHKETQFLEWTCAYFQQQKLFCVYTHVYGRPRRRSGYHISSWEQTLPAESSSGMTCQGKWGRIVWVQCGTQILQPSTCPLTPKLAVTHSLHFVLFLLALTFLDCWYFFMLHFDEEMLLSITLC